MELKKLPSKYSDTELLSLLDNKKDEVDNTVLEYKNDVLLFLTIFNITPGDNKVPLGVIKDLYKSWSKDPLRPQALSRELNKYLPNVNRYYMINKQALNISQEAYNLLLQKTYKITKSPTYRRHFENFLSRFKIIQGDYYMEHYVLYKLYEQWTYETCYKPLSYKKFFKLCCLYFKHKRKTSNRMEWFAINLGQLDISMAKLKALRDEHKKEIKILRKKRKEKQKKSN